MSDNCLTTGVVSTGDKRREPRKNLHKRSKRVYAAICRRLRQPKLRYASERRKHSVPADSYLRLIPSPIAEAIRQTTSSSRRSFAFACANLAVDYCTRAAVIASDDGERTLPELRDQTLAAREPSEIEAIDRTLGRREDQLYAAVSALRANDASAPYSEFVRLAAQRHAVRALRATLVPDGFSAAARAAFEALSATRDDQELEKLALATMPPSS
jgi:hypothetical protein